MVTSQVQNVTRTPRFYAPGQKLFREKPTRVGGGVCHGNFWAFEIIFLAMARRWDVRSL